MRIEIGQHATKLRYLDAGDVFVFLRNLRDTGAAPPNIPAIVTGQDTHVCLNTGTVFCNEPWYEEPVLLLEDVVLVRERDLGDA